MNTRLLFIALKTYFIAIILLGLAFFEPSYATKAMSSDQQTKQKIQKMVRNTRLSTHQLGIIVASPQSILYQLNANKKFIPASLIKIWTASVLLDTLPPSLQFQTQFLATQAVQNTTLDGHLYLRGGGDPSFVSESLWNLVNNLVRTGLKQVTGDLILDTTHFDKKAQGPRVPPPSHLSYEAPIGALSFNWNTANIYIRPGRQVGNPLQISIDPSPAYFMAIKNNTHTKASNKIYHSPHNKKSSLAVKNKPHNLSPPTMYPFSLKHKNSLVVSRQINRKNHRESLHIKGHLPLGHKEVLLYRNILYPAEWTGWNALYFLKQRGVQIKGKVKQERVPAQALMLAQWHSPPLIEQIRSMMKYSNNYMVEMLLKNMVVEQSPHPQGQLSEGLKMIKTYLHHKIGIPSKEYQLVQASGLSRKNKIRPIHLLKTLRYWTRHPLQADWESTLPLAGHEGTLKTRFLNSPLTSRIHAKTGHLTGVTGLAGYIYTSKNKKYLFVFIFNGPEKKQTLAEKLFDKIAHAIYTNH